DLVVFDPDTVSATDVELIGDLPGGSGRLYAAANGIKAVFVNGVATVRDGVATEALPGALLRAGADTETVPIPAAGD
ncbi:MAG: D-aminoacylase, partial [Acidimicrobiia bacterium]|nr:D-aminoacylase [Acidimicrobiia bacterium]